MIFSRTTAIVTILGFVLPFTGTADAAKIRKHNHVIHGIVVTGRSPVAGAHVHVKHHKKRSLGVSVVKTKVARAHRHHGTMSKSDGTFAMKHHHTGTITLVAHKKHVGSGHARVAAGKAANVTIRIHKHHHHHGK